MLVRPVANPPNPWAHTDVEYLEGDAPDVRLQVFEDHSRSVLSRNDSPDIPFTFSVNPYRGCFHACAYCFARPSHEYLSFGAGTDFDRKIVVKPDAPARLREAFDRPAWRGDVVVFSGVTDCYQPLEASYRLTRQCLEVCAAYRNPVAIVTKSPLVERDVDVLEELHRVASVSVAVSIPLWDAAHARALEPYVATPARRVRTIERLASRGIPVQLFCAPLIPGLSEDGLGELFAAAAGAGARGVGWQLLRLPGAVATIFEERVREALPLRAEKIMQRVRECRGGALSDARFGARGRGEGPYAEVIAALVARTAERHGLEGGGAWPARDETFQRPRAPRRQLTLFE